MNQVIRIQSDLSKKVLLCAFFLALTGLAFCQLAFFSQQLRQGGGIEARGDDPINVGDGLSSTVIKPADSTTLQLSADQGVWAFPSAVPLLRAAIFCAAVLVGLVTVIRLAREETTLFAPDDDDDDGHHGFDDHVDYGDETDTETEGTVTTPTTKGTKKLKEKRNVHSRKQDKKEELDAKDREVGRERSSSSGLRLFSAGCRYDMPAVILGLVVAFVQVAGTRGDSPNNRLQEGSQESTAFSSAVEDTTTFLRAFETFILGFVVVRVLLSLFKPNTTVAKQKAGRRASVQKSEHKEMTAKTEKKEIQGQDGCHAENKKGIAKNAKSENENEEDEEDEWWEREIPEDDPGDRKGNHAKQHTSSRGKSIFYSGTALVLLSPETNTLSPMGRPRWSLTVSDDEDDDTDEEDEDDKEQFFSFGRVSASLPKKQSEVDKKNGMVPFGFDGKKGTFLNRLEAVDEEKDEETGTESALEEDGRQGSEDGSSLSDSGNEEEVSSEGSNSPSSMQSWHSLRRKDIGVEGQLRHLRVQLRENEKLQKDSADLAPAVREKLESEAKILRDLTASLLCVH